jgi:AraC-like DNA-binding protein
MLARRFHMSRSQLYRLFADEEGVAAYIRSRRLHRCFQVITDPAHFRRAIGEIALGHGFNSEAHFSRLFRLTFGVTPSEARAGAVTGQRVGDLGRATFINDWMRDLQSGSFPPHGG